MIHGQSTKPVIVNNQNATTNSLEYDPDNYDKSFGIFEQF